jgi:hypothetical protein
MTYLFVLGVELQFVKLLRKEKGEFENSPG